MLKRNHLKLLSCVMVLAMTLSAFSGAAAFASTAACRYSRADCARARLRRVYTLSLSRAEADKTESPAQAGDS